MKGNICKCYSDQVSVHMPICTWFIIKFGQFMDFFPPFRLGMFDFYPDKHTTNHFATKVLWRQKRTTIQSLKNVVVNKRKRLTHFFFFHFQGILFSNFMGQGSKDCTIYFSSSCSGIWQNSKHKISQNFLRPSVWSSNVPGNGSCGFIMSS